MPGEHFSARSTLAIIGALAATGARWRTDGHVNHESVHEIRIDENADAVADAVFRIRFTNSGGRQTATVRLARAARRSTTRTPAR
jgi:hypothetical protein